MKRLLNFLRDHILDYLFVILLLGGVFYLAFNFGSFIDIGSNATVKYAKKLFDDSRVHKVEITINENDLSNMWESPREKIKYHTTVMIDGEFFDDVAFSVRGNGTLNIVNDLPDSNRYSYTLNFQKFNRQGSYYGLDKLSLNGLISDPSYLKDYLAYRIAAAAGLDVPMTSFTEVYINNELSGLYLATEGVDSAFLKRTKSSRDASLFHPIPYSIDHDRTYRDGKMLQEGEEAPWEAGMGYNGSDFVYRGESIEEYDAIFENAVTKYSPADTRFIIDAIESISEMSLNKPEDYWDIESIIKFFADASLTPNTDSYLGSTSQNYYLKKSNNKLSLIPWDYDRAFHITEEINESEFDLEDGAINWPIDSPLIGCTEEDRPLWRVISENPEYMKEYYAWLQKVIDNYMLNGECRNDFDSAVELIRKYVVSDPSRISSIEDFEQEVDYLRKFIILRADSIQKQLWDIPVEPVKDTSTEPQDLDLRVVEE